MYKINTKPKKTPKYVKDTIVILQKDSTFCNENEYLEYLEIGAACCVIACGLSKYPENATTAKYIGDTDGEEQCRASITIAAADNEEGRVKANDSKNMNYLQNSINKNISI